MLLREVLDRSILKIRVQLTEPRDAARLKPHIGRIFYVEDDNSIFYSLKLPMEDRDSRWFRWRFTRVGVGEEDTLDEILGL